MTAITRIDVGTRDLRPWQDLAEVGAAVSGVGEYRAVLHREHAGEPGHRYLLDLGSTAGGLGSVQVNDGAVTGFDTSRPLVDVTDDLRVGENRVTVRVSSSLNNRLLARGYYDTVPDILADLVGQGEAMQTTPVRDHGLLGPVRLVRTADQGPEVWCEP